MRKIAAIILAAGRGKRMNSKNINKAAMPLGNKQMILHAIDRLEELFISPIIVVVGFAKESVMEVLKGRVNFVKQEKRLGTAHAVLCAFKKLPKGTRTVLVLQGDDSAFYTSNLMKNLITNHRKKNAALSLLTITTDKPAGLGRVIRDYKGKIAGIVEEKDATQKQRKIKEINPACYVFEAYFLSKYLKKVRKSPVSGEYYLTSLIDIAIKSKQKIEAVKGGRILWRGVNTPEELKEAQRLFLSTK